MLNMSTKMLAIIFLGLMTFFTVSLTGQDTSSNIPAIVTLKRTIEHIHTESINDVEYDPLHNYFVTASDDDTVGIFDFDTGENIDYIQCYSNVLDVALNNDYSLLATCDNKGHMIIYKYPELIALKTIFAHYDSGRSLTFSSDGTKLISAGDDGLVKIWDVTDDFNILCVIEAHSDFITKVVTDANSNYIVTASEDNTLKVFDFTTHELLRTLTGHIDYIKGLDISSNGGYIVSGDDSGRIIIWNSHTGELLHTLTHHNDYIRSIDVSDDGKYFIASSDDGTISVWETSTGEFIRLYAVELDWVYDAIITTNGDYVIAVDDGYDAIILPFSQKAFEDASTDSRFKANVK